MAPVCATSLKRPSVAQPFERGTAAKIEPRPRRWAPLVRYAMVVSVLLPGHASWPVLSRKKHPCVSRFGHAGIEAGLADQGGMLVAAMPVTGIALSKTRR